MGSIARVGLHVAGARRTEHAPGGLLLKRSDVSRIYRKILEAPSLQRPRLRRETLNSVWLFRDRVMPLSVVDTPHSCQYTPTIVCVA